jgi:hypothetical protein
MAPQTQPQQKDDDQGQWYPPPPPPQYYDPRYTMGRKPNQFSSFQTDFPPSTTISASGTLLPDNSGQYTSGMSHQSGSPHDHPQNGNQHHGMSPAIMGAAGALATIAMLFLVGGLCLFMCRKGRKRGATARQQNRMTPGPEMAVKTVRTGAAVDTRAYIRPPSSEPPPTLLSPSSNSTPSSVQQPEAPVLLSNVIDRSYYTGMDTSDRFSVVEPSHQRESEGYASSITEPPPPYRPRSIPSFSRESSMRASGSVSGRPPSYGGKLTVRSQREQPIRSPFEDPDPDDQEAPVSPATAEPSNASMRTRDLEEMSDVSEISYQHEQTQPHSSV